MSDRRAMVAALSPPAAIWKFPLDVADEQLLMMPRDAKILSVQVQMAVPCLWAVVLPTSAKVQRRILTLGTGHSADYATFSLPYVGTYQLQHGGLVFHVFDAGQGA